MSTYANSKCALCFMMQRESYNAVMKKIKDEIEQLVSDMETTLCTLMIDR